MFKVTVKQVTSGCGYHCCVVFLVLIEEELHASYWLNKGKQALHHAINVQPKVYKAKNTILFLGDGELENQLSTVHTVPF